MWLLKCTEAAAGADASEGKLVKWEWTKIKSGGSHKWPSCGFSLQGPTVGWKELVIEC